MTFTLVDDARLHCTQARRLHCQWPRANAIAGRHDICFWAFLMMFGNGTNKTQKSSPDHRVFDIARNNNSTGVKLSIKLFLCARARFNHTQRHVVAVWCMRFHSYIFSCLSAKLFAPPFFSPLAVYAFFPLVVQKCFCGALCVEEKKILNWKMS